jgi:hypothetical protein
MDHVLENNTHVYLMSSRPVLDEQTVKAKLGYPEPIS